MVSQIVASPCSTPIIIAMVSILSISKNILFSVIVLLFYGIGSSLITLIFGSFIYLSDKMINSKKYEIAGKILNVILTMLIFCLALYMFYLGF